MIPAFRADALSFGGLETAVPCRASWHSGCHWRLLHAGARLTRYSADERRKPGHLSGREQGPIERVGHATVRCVPEIPRERQDQEERPEEYADPVRFGACTATPCHSRTR